MLPNTLLVATHNQGKIDEILAQLASAGLHIEVLSAHDVDFPEVVEDQPTFEGNARKKAQETADETGHVTLSDDSGICIDALGGDPGVQSKRWCPKDAQGKEAYAAAHEIIIEAARARNDYNAHFECVMALAVPHQPNACNIFSGRVDGTIARELQGTNGFGYDPFFVPKEGDGRTFGQMSPAHKARYSHRARALGQVIAYFESQQKGRSA